MTDDLISRAEAVAARYAHRFDEDPIGVSAGLFRAMVAALVASEPAPGSHQPPLPSSDAQGGEV